MKYYVYKGLDKFPTAAYSDLRDALRRAALISSTGGYAVLVKDDAGVVHYRRG